METGTRLTATDRTVKGDFVFDVFVNGIKTGTLRRLYKTEQWTYGCQWGYFSDVSHDHHQWYSFAQAEGSLKNFQPRCH